MKLARKEGGAEFIITDRKKKKMKGRTLRGRNGERWRERERVSFYIIKQNNVKRERNEKTEKSEGIV